MSKTGLTSMVARYWITKDVGTLDRILELACLLTPTVMPRGVGSSDDLQQTVNLNLIQHVRREGLPERFANSDDFRRLLGRMAFNARVDEARRKNRWERAADFIATCYLPKARKERFEAALAQEMLDEIRAVLTEERHIKVFDLLRQGHNPREIETMLGQGFSEPHVWVIRRRICQIASRHFERLA